MLETKEILLKIAGKKFSRYGFAKTSMDEIAKSAKKAKGLLYYHFNSKEMLFRAVVGSELNFLKEELAVIFHMKSSDSREVVKAYMLKRMHVLKSSINYQETLRPEFYEFYEFLNDIKNDFEKWEKNQVEIVLKRGIKAGELEIPGKVSIYSEVLVMLLKGLEIPFFIGGEYERLESHFDNLINVISKGISKH